MDEVRERIAAIQRVATADRSEALRLNRALVDEVRGRPLPFVLATSCMAETVLRTEESQTAEDWLAQGNAALPVDAPPDVQAPLRRAEAVVALALGQKDPALQLALEACQLASSTARPELQAICSQALGMILSSGGMVEEALDAALDARRAFLASGRTPPGGLENNIAINLCELDHFERSWDLADACVRTAAAEGRKGHHASALVTRGWASYRMGRYADAVADFEDGLQVARSVGNVQTLQVLHLNLGIVHAKAGDRSLAEAAFGRCQALLPARPSPWLEAGLAMERAMLLPDEQGVAMLEDARDLLDSMGRAFESVDAVHRLYEKARAAGRWEVALHHHEDWHRRREVLEQSRRRRRSHATQLRLEQEFGGRSGPLLAPEVREMVRDLEALGEDLRSRNRELEVLAARDGLTGLANRRAFGQRLAAELGRLNGEPLSLAVIDIDHFKAVNDTFGHAVGDAVLARVGAILSAGRRIADVVGRQGGDEFVLLLPKASAQAARSVAGRILERVRREPWGQRAPGLTVTLSIGVAEATGSDPEELFLAADGALYAAKQAGRDRVI